MNPTEPNSTSPSKKLKRNRLLSLITIIVSVCTIIIIATQAFGILHAMRPLTVTLKNNTNSEIMSVEFRMTHMDAPYVFERAVPAGESRNIRPEFENLVEGELTFTAVDAEGHVYTGIACGYTSTLSGESTVTIDTDEVTIQAECS
ncbi:hypothetical protein [Saccharibacillus sacchari]|uniref:Uncharacterized protein n=1 Tax=Saccharibacillus sacchari TaxID=456493 RepID=A0ACC6PK23_9BACL